MTTKCNACPELTPGLETESIYLGQLTQRAADGRWEESTPSVLNLQKLKTVVWLR